MQRVRMSLPYFVEAGWEVTVLTVDDPTPTAPVDPELAATIPVGVRVERAACLSRRWTAWLGVNNVALRSLPFLFRVGCRLLGARRYDVVYFSTTMFMVLPLGRLWKWLHGVPYVIDLQDPWVTDYYERPGSPRPPGGWKYWVAKFLGRMFEGWTMRGASHLIVVSSAYGGALRTRHPALQTLPVTELPFGSPDPDLELLRSTLASRRPILPAGPLRLAFAGAVGPGMLPAIEVLFAAMIRTRREGIPVSAHFYGTSYSEQARSRPAVLALACQYGLQDVVHEQSTRLRYFEALQVTLEAEANVLFGSTDLAFAPSKILAVLAAGRPVLAFAPTGSVLIARLNQLGQACQVFAGTDANEPCIKATVAHLKSLFASTGKGPCHLLRPAYSAHAVAERQLEILTSVSRA